jgi:hypothetical protein
MRQSSGTINVARSIFDHSLFKDGKPYSQREAWLWLIANAAWRPVQVMVRNGRSQELVNLERGQLTYSRSFLRVAWAWSSEKMVRTFLARLRQAGMLDLQTGQLQTVITVCNYSHFQFGGEDQGPANGPDMGQQRAGNGPEEEDIKNIKRKKMLPAMPEGFEDWYSIYPRKKQRQDAIKAFAKLIQSGVITLEALLAKTRAFAAAWEKRPPTDRQFIPYPASWLNKGEFGDEPDGASSQPTSAPIDPRSFTPGQWLKRLESHREGGDWLDMWGPRPGEPGCLVPPHLIVTPVFDGGPFSKAANR